MTVSFLQQAVDLTYCAFPEKFTVMYPSETFARKKLKTHLNLDRAILFDHQNQLYGLLGYFYQGCGFFNLSHPALQASVPLDQFYIEALMVQPAYRQAGIASWLLQEARKLASSYGYQIMSLDVACDNTAAIALYEKWGFQKNDATPVMPNTFQFPYFYRMVLSIS